MKFLKYIFFLTFIIVIQSCDEDNTSTVPSEDFSYYFDLDDEEFFNFDIGTSVALTSYDYDDDNYKESVGYCGIIIYQPTENVFYAYDLCCPIHVEEKEQLIINGALAICPCDSVYYNLMNGFPATNNSNYDGDASCLRSYSTKYYSSSNTLRVYNY